MTAHEEHVLRLGAGLLIEDVTHAMCPGCELPWRKEQMWPKKGNGQCPDCSGLGWSSCLAQIDDVCDGGVMAVAELESGVCSLCASYLRLFDMTLAEYQEACLQCSKESGA